MNYTIKPYKLPNQFNFSRNPIPFGFSIIPWSDINITSRHQIVVTLLFSHDIENPAYEEIWTGAISPDRDGYALLDVASLLDAKLEWFTPNPNLIMVQKAKKQCGIFKLRYYLADNYDILTTQHTSDAFYVYKGGVSREDFDNDATYLANTISNRGNLHYHDERELVRTDEPRWIFYIHVDGAVGVPTTECTIHVIAYKSNGTTPDFSTTVQTVGLLQYQVYCFPAGYTQLDIENNITDPHLITYYTATLQDQDPLDLCTVAFFPDRRPYYDVQYLLYRNSLGGLETQSLLGEKEFSMAISGERTESLNMADTMGDVLIQSQWSDPANRHTAVTKAHTGWLTRQVLLRLKDLLLNRQTYLPYGRRLRPVYVTTRGPVLYKNRDKLYSLPIDYSNAWEDENYNPENLVEFADICPAVEFIWGGQERGGYIWVMWKLPSGYDRIEFEYTVDIIPATTFNFIFEGTLGRAEIDINSASNSSIVDFEVTLKARCVCNDEVAPYSYGQWTTDLVIAGASLIDPVANDDVADISERSLAPRVLKIGGVDLDTLLNDTARNGGVLGFDGVYNAAGTIAIATSANGANVAQSGTGGILYSPTPASFANMAEDIIYYKCNEYVAPYGYLTSNLAKITVPLKGAIPKVYIRMNFIRVERSEVKYGAFGAFKAFRETQDIYVQFFKDPQFKIPIDVTDFGIIFAFFIQQHSYFYNSVGSYSGPSVSAGAIVPVTAIGFNMLIINNHPFIEWDPTGGGGYQKYNYIKSSLTGTTGNFVYTGW